MILQKLLKDIEAIEPVRKLDEYLVDGNNRVDISGLAGSAKSLAIAYACKKSMKPALVISSSIEEAEKLYREAEKVLQHLNDRQNLDTVRRSLKRLKTERNI